MEAEHELKQVFYLSNESVSYMKSRKLKNATSLQLSQGEENACMALFINHYQNHLGTYFNLLNQLLAELSVYL